MIIRRTFEDGCIGFGEVACLDPVPPVSWIDSPYGAFAQWSARQAVVQPSDPPPARSAALLNLDEATADELASLRGRGFKAFKLKLGVDRAIRESRKVAGLASLLLPGERLRLDPNRSWSQADWTVWKPVLRDIAPSVDFLEEPFHEPLPADEWMRLAEKGPVRLALDESLAGNGIETWTERNWPGFFVVKPSLLGNPERWLPLLLPRRQQVILSSAFETGIGLTAILRLAQHFNETIHGLGTQSFFNDKLGAPEKGDKIHPLTTVQAEELWNNLPAN